MNKPKRIPKVGDVGYLQKCKHSWNNGRVVEIVLVYRDQSVDGICIKAVDVFDGSKYVIGSKNFVHVESED